MRNAYTFEELEKIFSSKNLKETARELERTPVAIMSIRNKYSQWARKGQDPNNNTILPLFKQYKESGKELIKLKKGRAFGFSPTPTPPILEDTKEQTESLRDPFTEFDILCSQFNKQVKELVYQMVEDVYADHIKKEYDRLARKAFDQKSIKALQRRIVKGGAV